MDRRGNQFLEPDRGPGMVGWALKQLAIWLVGGFVVYSIVANHQLFTAAPPAAAPRSAAVAVGAAPADTAPGEKLRPLGQAAPLVTNSLTLRARADGYAYVQASINGMPMIMAFDTGASVVSLTQVDALKAGVAGNLNYTRPFWTANGQNLGAPVMLREIRIGQLVIENVEAVVMQHLGMSLLGQTFLNRLRSYQMQNGVLTLTWQ